MTTSRDRFEEPRRNRIFNLPLLLTVGAMILLGITTVTLGFVLRPEPRDWGDEIETPAQGSMKAPVQGVWPDPGPGDAGAARPDGR